MVYSPPDMSHAHLRVALPLRLLVFEMDAAALRLEAHPPLQRGEVLQVLLLLLLQLLELQLHLLLLQLEELLVLRRGEAEMRMTGAGRKTN